MFKKTENYTEKDEAYSERDEMEKAMKQEFMMTVDPALGYIPKERLIAALDYQRRMFAARGSDMNAISWNERGPNNIAGRTRALLVDAKDASGNTVIAGSVSGGIWKTTNFKLTNPTWTHVNPNMGSLAVCALAQDPLNKDIMYAGTGEGWFNSDAVRGNGLWKSSDGGNSWNQLVSTDSTVTNSAGQTIHRFDFVQDIVVNPQGVVFVSARPSKYCNLGGVVRSADGGNTWSQVIGVLTAQTCDSAYNYFGGDLELASNGDLYATTGYINSGEITDLGRIWRSTAANAGATGTWVDITPTGTWQRIEIAIAPSNPAVIYAVMEGSGDGIGAIKKSINSGASWTDLPIPTWCNQGSNSSDFTNGQAFYDLIVQVDPTNENNVYIGGIDLFKSTNGGTSWTQITQWARNCTAAGGVQLPVVHADQHNLMFFPGSGTDLIATNDGGIYYSTDAGATWVTTTFTNVNGANQTTVSQKNIGYNTIQLYSCDIHPTTTDYFLVGAQDNGSLKLTAPGLTTGQEASVGGDGGYCHIDQTNGTLQVLSYVYNNFYISRNGGTSFTRTTFNDEGQFINPSDLDDANKVLYTGYTSGKLGLVSNLLSVTPSFSSFTIPELGARKVSAVKVDPTSGGGTVWIAGHDSTFALRPIIIKLNNANTAPVAAVSTTLFSVPAGSYVSSIDVEPGNANHILVTLSNYGVPSVFESTNGGTSFTSVEGTLPDIPVRWGIILPASLSVNGTTGGGILLATEAGVYFTQTTSGASTAWTPQTSGIPNVRTDMLRYRASDGLLAVATHGRGLYTATLTTIATGIPSVPDTKNFIDYISASGQELFVKVGNLNTINMEMRLFAADGKLVYSSKAKYSNQHIPISKLASGSYVLKIYGNKNEQFTRQFIK